MSFRRKAIKIQLLSASSYNDSLLAYYWLTLTVRNSNLQVIYCVCVTKHECAAVNMTWFFYKCYKWKYEVLDLKWLVVATSSVFFGQFSETQNKDSEILFFIERSPSCYFYCTRCMCFFSIWIVQLKISLVSP